MAAYSICVEPRQCRAPFSERFVCAPAGRGRVDRVLGLHRAPLDGIPPGTRGAPKPYQVWRPEATEEHLQLGTTPRTRCFIPATVDDNRYIDAEYKSALLELPEAKKQALLYGDWDTYEGQFFAEFTEDTHVIDPISPQPHWPKWRGLDHGFYDPLVCIWFTMNPEDGQIIGYRELYKGGHG